MGWFDILTLGGLTLAAVVFGLPWLLKVADRLSWVSLVTAGLLLGLAPLWPEPHLVEKVRMLAEGELRRPLDIFDLVLHGAFPLLLALKLLGAARLRLRGESEQGQ